MEAALAAVLAGHGEMSGETKMVQESTFFTRSIGETGFLTPFFVLSMMVLLMSF